MPALTRGRLRALLEGSATPRDDSEIEFVMENDEKLLLACAKKYPWAVAACLCVVMFIAWLAWYGILATVGYATGCNLRPTHTAALVLAVQILVSSPSSRL